MANNLRDIKILSIDIGGSSIKATILSNTGELLQDFTKIKTPDPATPEKVLSAIQKLTQDFEPYDRISVGFPGYIRKGIVFTAPNLGTHYWKNVNLNGLISDALHKPVRIINDADLQGLGMISEKGLEMVITLGTGFGTALFLDGNLLPHVEMGQHPATKTKTYDQYIGDSALNSIDIKKWNKRIARTLKNMKTTFNYDHLYISGGNAKKIKFKLDDNITISDNRDGIKGGARLWRLDEDLFMKQE